MLGFLRNFWVCLGFTLLCAYLAAISYTDGSIGWTRILGLCSLMWLNDARKALKRDMEADSEPQQRD